MLAAAYPPARAPEPPDPQRLWSQTGCTAADCHATIEPIRQPDTGMMRKILARGREFGDPDGCVVCHGGDPTASTAGLAHHGNNPALREAGGPDAFFPDPASPWVNERSCGPVPRGADRRAVDHTLAQLCEVLLVRVGEHRGGVVGRTARRT